jgi:glutaconyl-CoA/methylmalonyl-CoA decarboxylase subunit delta
MIRMIGPNFSQIDSFATTIAIVGYLVVFIALVLLYFVFYNLPSLLRMDLRKLILGKNNKETALSKAEVKVTGEINAAIGMAIFLYINEMHDEESGVITIKKISKRYSPWSSKIYGLRQYPRH